MPAVTAGRCFPQTNGEEEEGLAAPGAQEPARPETRSTGTAAGGSTRTSGDRPAGGSTTCR
ncbi:hypothetical protein GCM10010524_01550 [Streptomyces mexicanus]